MKTCLGLMLVLPTPLLAAGTTGMPTAAESDPVVLQLMQGSPVPRDKQVRSDDGSMFTFPKTRWAYSHQQALLPTAVVQRAGAVSPLAYSLRPEIDAITFDTAAFDTTRKRKLTWREAFDANYTDGLIVLHRGRVVYERYAGALGPHGRHIAMSATKSFVGTLALLLIDDGRLDRRHTVGSHVPELARSGFGDATIGEVMDMRTAIAFDEDYRGTGTELTPVTRMMIAAGIAPAPFGYRGPDGIFAFIAGIGGQGKHGGDFSYRTPNTLALQWVVERAGGVPFATQLAERIWKPMGMEQEGSVDVDRIGTAFGGGGLNASLRDLARFGEMIRNGGQWNGRQVLPSAVVRAILSPGDPAAFAATRYPGLEGGSYANQWWHRATGQTMALGVSGQMIYIDPENELVIVRFASNPVASNRKILPITLPAFDALAEHLRQSGQ